MTNEQYYEMINPYQDSLHLLLARLDVLNRALYRKSSVEPIHDVQSRVKSKKSLEDKLERLGFTASVRHAKNQLQDIAGIRVICYFVEDVYNLADILKRQSDLVLIKEKDYIKTPKENGYRSYHVVFGVPVSYRDVTEYFPVEIQIRTMGMDFWASMEHRVCYKIKRKDKQELQEILLQYAGIVQSMESGFAQFREESEEKHPQED